LSPWNSSERSPDDVKEAKYWATRFETPDDVHSPLVVLGKLEGKLEKELERERERERERENF
jgi:hypothetical protein